MHIFFAMLFFHCKFYRVSFCYLREIIMIFQSTWHERDLKWILLLQSCCCVQAVKVVCPTLLLSQGNRGIPIAPERPGWPCTAGRAAELLGEASSSSRLPGHKQSDVSVCSLVGMQELLGKRTSGSEQHWLIRLQQPLSLPSAALGAGRALPDSTVRTSRPRCLYVAQLGCAVCSSSARRGAGVGWPFTTSGSQVSQVSLHWDSSLSQNKFSSFEQQCCLGVCFCRHTFTYSQLSYLQKYGNLSGSLTSYTTG